MSAIDPLQHLTEQLEQTAAKLREGELEPREAARLVEECAHLAGDAAAELDRRARAVVDAPAAPAPTAPQAPGPGAPSGS